MKRFSILLSLLIVLSMLYSCKRTPVIAGFEDMEQFTIYDYLMQNQKDFSSFLAILKAGNLDKTLSAYNPNGIDYTLFAPDNKAVDAFLKSGGQYSTMDALLKDKAYVSALARYHVVNMGTSTYEFPFGTFSEPTLSGDFLNVNFILAKDTTYYKINNQAPVSKANIELSNGYIHVISTMLTPITQNSYGWLKLNPSFTILTEAIEATGYKGIIDKDMKDVKVTLRPFTVLAEPNSVYKKRNVNNFQDLAKLISPGRTDYTNSTNPLNLFVGYHILNESSFLNELQGRTTNYNTFADIPLTINGLGLDIVINKGKEVFDVIIRNQDTTIIDYVGLDYDASNVITQSGAIHFIDQILKPQVPSRAIVTYEFWDEPALAEYRRKGGSYLIENEALMYNVKWSGAKLYYVKSFDESERAWSKDYLQIDGDFNISYQVPKIIQGKYNVFLGADAFSSANALVEMYVDGTKLGGLIDLTRGGNSSWPYVQYKVGAIDFKKYAAHTITIKTLIPGRFRWDYIRFEPI
ncbi:MAG: fasciclin domain-containing protein [Bacteroidota bacterium]|nr:fasciclin domain-containing protein [Bacteroidota bacterium]